MWIFNFSKHEHIYEFTDVNNDAEKEQANKGNIVEGKYMIDGSNKRQYVHVPVQRKKVYAG